MREYKNRTRYKRKQRPVIVPGWLSWNWLSAGLREREFYTVSNIYSDDRGSWTDQFSIDITWYGYKAAITIASVAAFFFGIGQLILKLIAG